MADTYDFSTLNEVEHDVQPRPSSWNPDKSLIVLILVGLIASASKSTFAQALEEYIPEFHRCNQDELGKRQDVEREAHQSLSSGISVCIDRTNFDEKQRSHWVNIAREFPKTKIWCLVFDTPFETCRNRLRNRTNHPTIFSPEKGYRVLNEFRKIYSPPTANEGFDRIFRLRPSDHPSPQYTRDDLERILNRIASSELPRPEVEQPGIRNYFASNSRGRGSGRNWRGSNRGNFSRDSSYGHKFSRPLHSTDIEPNWRNRSSDNAVPSRFRSQPYNNRPPDRERNDGQGLRAGHDALADNRLAHIHDSSGVNGSTAVTPPRSSQNGTVSQPFIID